MDNTPHSPRHIATRSKLLTALGLLAGVATLLTAVLLRRGRSAVTPLETLSPPYSPAEVIQQSVTPKPASNFSPVRWLVFFLVMIGIGFALILLQNSDSSISVAFFIALVLGSAGIGIRSYPQETRKLVFNGLSILRTLPRTLRTHRTAVSIAAVLLSAGCMLQAASGFYLAGRDPWLVQLPVRWLLAGTLVLGIAAALNPLPMPLLDKLPTRLKITGIHRKTVILGMLTLAFLAEINGNALHIFSPEIHYNTQIALFVIGIGCLILGFRGDWRWPKVGRIELLALLVITGLALFLRTIVLETSIHRFVDEIHYVGAIIHLEEQPYTRILTPFSDVTAFTWIYPYLQTISVRILGHSLFAMRLVSSLVGTLTIPALYFLGRTLFDRTTAGVAALLLATFPAHLHFSRIGLNNIADPLVGVLALAFMARAWKGNRRTDYVIAGVMLGLTQYFYEGGRLLFPALAIAWVVTIWLSQRGWRDDREKAVLALVVMLLVAAPVYYTSLTTQGALTPRLNSNAVSLKDWATLFRESALDSMSRYERFAFPFLTYINVADTSWFYGGHQALILSAILPIFLLGVGFVVWYLRAPGPRLLLLWVIGVSFGNILLLDNAWTPRYVVVFPALALILAMGIRYGIGLFWRWRGRIILIALITFAAAGWQANYYFNEHLPLFAVQFRGALDTEDIYFRLRDIPAGTEVHIIYGSSIWQFNLDNLIHFWKLSIKVDFHYPQELTPAFMATFSRTTDHAFFIDPNDEGSLDTIRQYFYLLPPRFSPFDVPMDKQFGLYYAPRFTRS